jgi:hypothetical protein
MTILRYENLTRSENLNLNFYDELLRTLTFMYKNSCGFVCEDFPQENQTLQTRNDL